MKDIVNITAIGRLVRNPDLKETKTGKKVISFSLAINHYGDEVSYIDCQAWEKLAETINQYCEKGNQVGISGSLKQERWQDGDGKNKSKIIIIVKDIQFLTPRTGTDNGIGVKLSNDDIPF